MKLTFLPSRSPSGAPLAYEVRGDILAVNGTPFDFSPLGEGETLPRAALDGPDGTGSPWLAGPVTREGGTVALAVICPVPPGWAFVGPAEQRVEGPVSLPVAPAEEDAA